jgi:hypothetical protein
MRHGLDLGDLGSRGHQNESLVPAKLAKLDEEIEALIQARAALVTVWRRMVNERQPT